MVLEVGSMLGTVPLEFVYVADDEGLPAEWDVRGTFATALQIVDGPGAAVPTTEIEAVRAGMDFDGGTVEVARNGFVGVTLVGQHALGRDWDLVSAGDAVRAFCPPRVFTEGPGPKDMGWLNDFTFTAMAPGDAEIELEYRDAADPDAVLDTYRPTVTVL